MKAIKLLPFFILLISCKSYPEYTMGIKELNYSFDHRTVKRFHNLDVALKNPDRVVFLDLSFTTAKNPGKLYIDLNENIEKFRRLKKLVLEGNDKYIIPENIFKIQTLEFLSLNAFQDSSSFNKLSQLHNLRFLSLDFCGLNHVPESVPQLKRLQGLDLTGNEITYLPAEFETLRELITLDLTNNLFTAIPESLKQIPKLKYLDLNNAEGTDREQLARYHVGVNDIKTVPDLSEFKSLKELDVTYAYDATDSLRKQYAHVKVR